MMFSGFGVRIIDIPSYLKWGTTFSYLRYSLEGYVAAVYENRTTLPCEGFYCHYRYPSKFLEDVNMPADQFWNDIIALTTTLVLAKVAAYLLLRWKIRSMRWSFCFLGTYFQITSIDRCSIYNWYVLKFSVRLEKRHCDN